MRVIGDAAVCSVEISKIIKFYLLSWIFTLTLSIVLKVSKVGLTSEGLNKVLSRDWSSSDLSEYPAKLYIVIKHDLCHINVSVITDYPANVHPKTQIYANIKTKYRGEPFQIIVLGNFIWESSRRRSFASRNSGESFLPLFRFYSTGIYRAFSFDLEKSLGKKTKRRLKRQILCRLFLDNTYPLFAHVFFRKRDYHALSTSIQLWHGLQTYFVTSAVQVSLEYGRY